MATSCAPARAGDSDVQPAHVDVYRSGDDGYDTYRIPAIETAPDGTLLAFAEARKLNGADPGFEGNDIDLVMKRSSDGGRTWSAMQVIDDPGEQWSACNPATLVDRSNGRVWLFNCRTKPGRSSLTARAGTRDAQNWARYSADGGATWSEPIDLTDVARDVANWGGSFYGPGGGIQTRSGRLIVPLARTTGQRDADG
ncbi:MAG: exo-alpha-sialidase [Planctomycetales bacterium]|nr:exo-alpha-sialidase [Planctomycetales bacterium]